SVAGRRGGETCPYRPSDSARIRAHLGRIFLEESPMRLPRSIHGSPRTSRAGDGPRSPRRGIPARRGRPRAGLRLEALEDRTLPAVTFQVLGPLPLGDT